MTDNRCIRCKRPVVRVDWDIDGEPIHRACFNDRDAWHATKRTPELERLAAEVGYLARERNEAMNALAFLVGLKDLKDKQGKTPEYEKRQPLAWAHARVILETYGIKPHTG